MIRPALIALVLSVGPALAEAPERSVTPPKRPPAVAGSSAQGTADAAPVTTPAATAAAPVDDRVAAASPRPKPRPTTGPAATRTEVRPPAQGAPVAAVLDTLLTGNAGASPTRTTVVQKTAAAASASAQAVARSPVPRGRPENLQRRNTVQRTGLAALFQNSQRETTEKGSVCGVNTVKGVRLQPIPGRINGCGVEEPVKVVSVAGVSLSQPITVDCPTAVALDTWVRYAVKPTVGRLGGGVAGLNIMASYACRPRNNQKGGRISEHGRGRAVDVGGIILANGEQISVLEDWRSNHAPVMKALHKQACGNFGTVLGPNSDRFHQNHFHFDTASYRSGAYCR